MVDLGFRQVTLCLISLYQSVFVVLDRHRRSQASRGPMLLPQLRSLISNQAAHAPHTCRHAQRPWTSERQVRCCLGLIYLQVEGFDLRLCHPYLAQQQANMEVPPGISQVDYSFTLMLLNERNKHLALMARKELELSGITPTDAEVSTLQAAKWAAERQKQVAVVVGASRGIGRQIAIDLAKEGYAGIFLHRLWNSRHC